MFLPLKITICVSHFCLLTHIAYDVLTDNAINLQVCKSGGLGNPTNIIKWYIYVRDI